jgi:hypothetical protein
MKVKCMCIWGYGTFIFTYVCCLEFVSCAFETASPTCQLVPERSKYKGKYQKKVTMIKIWMILLTKDENLQLTRLTQWLVTYLEAQEIVIDLPMGKE